MLQKLNIFLFALLVGVLLSSVSVDLKLSNAKASYEYKSEEVVATSTPVVTAVPEPTPTSAPTPIVYAPSIPTQLDIPKIDLNTNIIKVGIDKEGRLDVPPNYTEVGWYKYGTKPGQIGSAVLDGHVDDGASVPGPFKRLREMEVADDIYVEMESGEKLHYIVMNTAVYDTKKFPGELIFHDKSGPLLKIITCHGTFVKAENTYDKRLVVTAILAQH